MKIRKYSENDVPAMIRIWNEVVEEGVAFPQLELLDKESGRAFFAAQTYCGVADDNGTVVGLYILHPNNVGRCGHIANASYAVNSACRGQHIGESLFEYVKQQAKEQGCYEVTLNFHGCNNICNDKAAIFNNLAAFAWKNLLNVYWLVKND